MITLDQTSAKGPELPFTIYDHGMVKYNDHAIYIIGGWQNDSTSKDTWIVDPSNEFKIRKGPSLKEAREEFSCGKMILHGKVYLVVAGGSDESGSSLDSVEILDPSSDQGWTSGIVKSIH